MEVRPLVQAQFRAKKEKSLWAASVSGQCYRLFCPWQGKRGGVVTAL